LKTLDPTPYGRTKNEYEKLVKQPMDFETIRKKLDQPPENTSAYKSASGFSKDHNHIFSNVMKAWSLGDDIANAARRLQTLWVEKWTDLAPILMRMEARSDEEKPNEEEESSLDGLLEYDGRFRLWWRGNGLRFTATKQR
jgi:HD-like signal output (HDOD) protein